MDQADENRHFALHLAHDLAKCVTFPQPTAEDIVARAQVYLAFLDPAPAVPLKTNRIEFPSEPGEGEFPCVIATSEDERTVEVVVAGFAASADARDVAATWEPDADIEETVITANENPDYWDLHLVSRRFDTVEEANAFIERARTDLHLDNVGRA